MNFFEKIPPKFVAFLIIVYLLFALTGCPSAPPTKTVEVTEETIKEVTTIEEEEEPTEEVKEEEIQPMIWSDSQIGIILDKVERADSIPPDLSKLVSSLSEGHDLILVYLTIAHIENVHVVSLGGRGDEFSALHVAEGHRYKTAAWSFTGAKLQDPHDVNSPLEFIEGSTCTLVFEIPKHKKPSTLTFVYYFKDTLEDKSKKSGQININL